MTDDTLPLLLSPVNTRAGLTACGMNWEVVAKSQDYSHPLSVLCFMMSGREGASVWNPFLSQGPLQ